MRPQRECRRSSSRWARPIPIASAGMRLSPRCPRYARRTERQAASQNYRRGSALASGRLLFGRAFQRLGGAIEQAGEIPTARAGDWILPLDRHFPEMRRPPPQIAHRNQAVGILETETGGLRLGAASDFRPLRPGGAAEVQPEEARPRPERGAKP